MFPNFPSSPFSFFFFFVFFVPVIPFLFLSFSVFSVVMLFISFSFMWFFYQPLIAVPSPIEFPIPSNRSFPNNPIYSPNRINPITPKSKTWVAKVNQSNQRRSDRLIGPKDSFCGENSPYLPSTKLPLTQLEWMIKRQRTKTVELYHVSFFNFEDILI